MDLEDDGLLVLMKVGHNRVGYAWHNPPDSLCALTDAPWAYSAKQPFLSWSCFLSRCLKTTSHESVSAMAMTKF